MGKDGGCIPGKKRQPPAAAPSSSAFAAPREAPEELAAPNAGSPAVAVGRKLRLYIVFYSMYGHVESLARRAVDGVEAVLRRLPETLPLEVLEKMQVPPKDPAVPIIASAAELQEAAGFFVFSGTQGGGQETTTEGSEPGLGAVAIGSHDDAIPFSVDSVTGSHVDAIPFSFDSAVGVLGAINANSLMKRNMLFYCPQALPEMLARICPSSDYQQKWILEQIQLEINLVCVQLRRNDSPINWYALRCPDETDHMNVENTQMCCWALLTFSSGMLLHWVTMGSNLCKNQTIVFFFTT